MEQLGTYIVETLKNSGINVILQQDYLRQVANDLINYIIISNSLSVLFGLVLLISAIVSYIKGQKKQKIDIYYWDDAIGRILFIIGTSLFGVILFFISIFELIQVIVVPDIAIIKYIS